MSFGTARPVGPALSVITYGSEDEAIRIANDSKDGLRRPRDRPPARVAWRHKYAPAAS